MPLQLGARLGPYEILSALGAGGMGEVYKARDTRLDRTVAIKILTDTLAADPQFRERFDREGRAISQIEHPNICTLHDVGEENGTAYIVMQYLEGETLGSRLRKGALPLDQVLPIAMQIASALDKAHRAGIIHRDLKPGNVMLTKSGVKLLDFGLAKLTQGAPAPGTSLSQLPTETDPLTARGTILGTVPYMAPEQLEGKEADARTDIFAFGAVTYEMATGKKAFEGKSQASLIAKILESDPAPMRSLQPMTPASLDRLVRTCLAKDPDQRFQSATDIRLELEWIRDAARERAESGGAARGWRAALSWAIVAAALAFAAFAWLRGASVPNTVQADPVRFEIPLPKSLTRFTASFALSPDGGKLAFAAVGSDGIPRIWIRDLASLETRPLAGTDSVGGALIWSPEGRSIAFNSSGKLLKVDIAGGFPTALCNLDRVVLSGAWSKDGVILFGGVGGPMMRVSADGGAPTPVTALDVAHGDVAHLNPYFLPDGRHFLYVRETNRSEDISVASLDAKPTEQDARRLIEGGVIGPMYLPSPGRQDSGELLFVRGTTLMAQRLDASHLTLSGDPVRVLDAAVAHFVDAGLYSVANNGTLVYRAPGNSQGQLTWFDEKGKPLATVGPPGLYNSLFLSPDGTRALVSKTEPSSTPSLWLIDTSRDDPGTPLASDPATGYNNGGAWSPDGRNMIFNVGHSGEMTDLYERSIDGAGEGAVLVHSGKGKHALSWSKNGFLLFNVNGKGAELWAVPVKEPGNAGPLLQGGANYRDAEFSPDGRWVVYASDESSRPEIYVKSFSEGHLGNGGRVSPNGGVSPKWGQNGTLYYLGLDDKLMMMKLALGTAAQAGAPMELFPAPHTSAWAPSPDGKRFLFLVPQQQQDTPLTVVLNWDARLSKE